MGAYQERTSRKTPFVAIDGRPTGFPVQGRCRHCSGISSENAFAILPEVIQSRKQQNIVLLNSEFKIISAEPKARQFQNIWFYSKFGCLFDKTFLKVQKRGTICILSRFVYPFACLKLVSSFACRGTFRLCTQSRTEDSDMTCFVTCLALVFLDLVVEYLRVNATPLRNAPKLVG
jgi:hypothetical protein